MTDDGTKGNPQYANSDAAKFAEYLSAVSTWAADHAGESVSTASDLPDSGNWDGRTSRVQADGSLRVWDATASAWVAIWADTSIAITTFATGWSAVTGYTPTLRRIGNRVDIFGAIARASSSAAITNICTVPTGWEPGAKTLLPAGIDSAGSQTQTLYINTSGVIQVAYGDIGATAAVVLTGSYYLTAAS